MGKENSVKLGGSIECPINNYYTTSTTLVCEVKKQFYPLDEYEVKVTAKGVEMACSSPCKVIMD